jgi:vitamin K-dependent gamma-carboxylase
MPIQKEMKGSNVKAFVSWLSQPMDPLVLGIFRIGFGLFMTYTMIHYFEIGLIRNMFVLPQTNFQYDFLRWIKPLPEIYLNVLLGLLLIAALAISAGLWFKWACRLFALGYAYIFLLDKSIYNNHIYLFILLAILLSFTNADRVLSLWKKRSDPVLTPGWQVFILQMQIVIVYFYGGIAKLTKDWLFNCQPVRVLVDKLPTDHILAPIFKNEAGIYLLNYGGLIIDLGAPLFLWYKPLRKWAIFLFIGFNLLNSRIFSDIGIFPYVMLFSLLLFYTPGELPVIRRLKENYGDQQSMNQNGTELRTFGIGAISRPAIFLYFFFVFQLLFPFRGHFLPNPLDWTTIGNHFSWRMKVDTRDIEEMNFFIHSPAYDQPVPVDIHTFVNDMQIRNLSMDPRSVVDFAKYIKAEAIRHGAVDPDIRANIRLKYNGRPPQFFVDPETDLSSLEVSPFRKLDWVYPVQE